jgi:hypothetical protein
MGRPNTVADFWANVEIGKPDECWRWKLRLTKGYGRGNLDGRTSVAHRIAYELAIGPIPEGLTIDHMCHSAECKLGEACPHRACCNPAHLEPATALDNARRGNQDNRGIRKREQTHCIRNHEFTPVNTYVRPNGTRVCRECGRLADLARWPKRKIQRQQA